MKSQTHIRKYPTFGTLLAAAGLFVAGQARAQEYALLTGKLHPPVSARAESARPYWKMTSPSGTDSTLVGFYTPGNDLMHEEMLPSPAVKLTKRTLQKLNEMTDRLQAANGTPLAADALLKTLTGKSAPAAGQLQMGTYAAQDGIHLHLMLDNPARDYVMIKLIGTQGGAVYQTSTRENSSHYKFNLEGVPAGAYKLLIVSKKQRFERDVTFGYPAPEPIQPSPRIAIK